MDAGFGAELPAEIAMMFGIVAFVGEHGADPRHDGKSGQEQPLEHQSVIDVRRGGHAGDGHAVTHSRDVVFGAPFAPVSWIGPSQVTAPLGPHRAGIEDQGRIAPQHADQDGMNLRQYTGARPLLEMAAQGRTADPARGGLQTAPRCAFPEKLPQSGQHSNCRRSGMAATPLLRWRAEIDDRRDQVQKPEVQCLLPCLKLQTWSSLIDNAPPSCCTTTVPLNRPATAPSTLSISGNRLLSPCRTKTKSAGLAPSCIIRVSWAATLVLVRSHDPGGW